MNYRKKTSYYDLWIRAWVKHFGLGIVFIKDPVFYTVRWKYEVRIALLFIECIINFGREGLQNKNFV